MRGVSLALGAGLALLVVGTGLTLLRSPMTVAAMNRPHDPDEQLLARTRRSTSYCQGGEGLPRGTSAIRMSLVAAIGPRVRVVVSAAGRTLTSGEQEPAWTGSVVAVPVRPLRRAFADVTVCARVDPANETLGVLGEHTPPARAAREHGRPLAGRMWVEYLRPGTRSWASLAPSILRNMGFARAVGGEGIAFLALALLAAVALLTSRVALTELRR